MKLKYEQPRHNKRGFLKRINKEHVARFLVAAPVFLMFLGAA